MSATPIDRLVARDAGLPALFTYGFRPFFLAGALAAALAVPLWLLMLVTGAAPAGPFDALDWHAHEMIFGYIGAVVAGFVLTAVPNWTGRLPVTGWPLTGLFALWVAGRFASAAVPWPIAAAVVDMAFLVTLAGAGGAVACRRPIHRRVPSRHAGGRRHAVERQLCPVRRVLRPGAAQAGAGPDLSGLAHGVIATFRTPSRWLAKRS